MQRAETISLLKEIYQNATTATEAMQILSVRAQNSHLTGALTAQSTTFREIAQAAADALCEQHILPPAATGWARINLFTDLFFRTALDKTPAHIARILIDAGTAGAVSITQHLRTDSDAAPAVRKLAHRLLDAEQHCIVSMQIFL